MTKRSYKIARLFALLAGLIGLLNAASPHVYSSGRTLPTFPGHGNTTRQQYLARVKEAYAKTPLRFETNHGQADERVKFLSRGNGYSLQLTPTTFTLAIISPHNRDKKGAMTQPLAAGAQHRSPDSAPTSALVLRAVLLGANPTAKIIGVEQLPTRTNYFIGNDPRKWRTNIPNYAKTRHCGVYPGVDLVFYGDQKHLENDFIISPGAEPDVIAVAFEGAREMRVDAKGDLILSTAAGDIRQSRPLVYKQVGDGRRIIPASYVMKGNNRLGFQIAKYDTSKPLVIDPVIEYSTYLGGGGSDNRFGIAVDSAGNAYITGSTVSTDFPVTAGAFQVSKAGPFSSDAFVAKLNPSGTALVYSTYFGGDNTDAGDDIAVDSAGNAYVTGRTDSANLPTTPGAFRTSIVGSDEFDAFTMKLNATGTGLVYSTYLGPVIGSGIAVDSAGNAFIAGQANGDYPTTPGSFQTAFGGNSDAFVTKLNPTGTALVYSTFLGGSGDDFALDIELNLDGNATVVGATNSANFPVTGDAIQGAYAGNNDGFITILDAAGASLTFSTYLGGSGSENITAVASDSAGSIYVTGTTFSNDFPTTPGALQPSPGGPPNAFVVKVVFSSFDVCLKDDGDGSLFQFNTSTGEYIYTQCSPGGVTLTGVGVLAQHGCLQVLEDRQSGLRVRAQVNACNKNGQAVIQIGSGAKRTFLITDKDKSDNDCSCS